MSSSSVSCVKCDAEFLVFGTSVVVRCPECGTRNAVTADMPIRRASRPQSRFSLVVGVVLGLAALGSVGGIAAVLLSSASRVPEPSEVARADNGTPQEGIVSPKLNRPSTSSRVGRPPSLSTAAKPTKESKPAPSTPGDKPKQFDEPAEEEADRGMLVPKERPAAAVKLGDLPAVVTYPAPAERPKKEATPGYYKRTAHRFTMYVSLEAHEQSDKLDGQPLGCLESELQTIAERLPESVVKQLARVPIWVEWDHVLPRHTDVLAVYHSTVGEALLLKGVDPRKNQCVTVMTLKQVYLLKSRDKFPTTLLLHELAHAVHDQVLGFDNPLVINAYEQAQTRKLYAKVEHAGGEKKDGYAMTNSAEYFAELSACYLDRITYFPTDAAGLREYDSPGYELMTKVWGTEKAIEAAKKADAERKAKMKK